MMLFPGYYFENFEAYGRNYVKFLLWAGCGKIFLVLTVIIHVTCDILLLNCYHHHMTIIRRDAKPKGHGCLHIP